MTLSTFLIFGGAALVSINLSPSARAVVGLSALLWGIILS